MSIPVNKSQGELSLSLTGMRIAPRDPNSHQAKVGVKQEVFKPEHSANINNLRVLKERPAFSGGFKIPEEYRKNKQQRQGSKKEKLQEQDIDSTQQNQITKDEIFNNLNLGHNDSGMGIGRHGTNTKGALAKDLVEGIEKDLEKLRRQQENIQLRKQIALKGAASIVEQTESEKQKELEIKLKHELQDSGAFVIAASPKKLQVMRHQASQLASNKNLSLEELEEMRMENDARLKQLEEAYLRKRENTSVGRIIRDKMGYSSNQYTKSNQSTPRERGQENEGSADEESHFFGKRSKSKTKKSVRIADHNNDDIFDRDEKPNAFGVKIKDERSYGSKHDQHSYNHRDDEGQFRHKIHSVVDGDEYTRKASRSHSRKRKVFSESPEPAKNLSPRRNIYEAKFEKYIANKENKEKVEKKLAQYEKEDFDRYTKDQSSPSKQTYRYKVTEDKKNPFNRYDVESLVPKTYDENLLMQEELRKSQQVNRKDEFKNLGVDDSDKMTFFLLKWVFGAIKRDSSPEDPKLKGKSYVTKNDLVKQLSRNDELMQNLGYDDSRELSEAVKVCGCIKDGCLMWEEFLDFFFLKNASYNQRVEGQDNWWRQIGKEGQQPNSAKGLKEQSPEKQAYGSPLKMNPVMNNAPRYGGAQKSTSHQPYDDPDKKPIKMTESIKILQDTRKQKLEKDVEDEFKTLQEKKLIEQKQSKQQPSPLKKSSKKLTNWDVDQDNDMIEETLGIKREKSECLLLASQIHIMKDIFEAMDRYNDQILRRAQFIMQLRTDERVVGFIDIDAIKIPYTTNRTLTLDEVLVEIEKDEMYEMVQMGKHSDQINHKEFITWREFINYFTDYREIEERNRKTKEIQRTRQSLQKERNHGTHSTDQDAAVEVQSLMEQEKERRLKELPKLRPADQIDISEKQLQLIRDIYDSLPKAQIAKDFVHTIDFFIAIRKNPQIRTISSAIARDPDGTSRLHRETFQQVFDRMENEIQTKQLDWTTIVEYFTKRGRPLTKEEIFKLQDEDRKEREAEEQKKRHEEEAERRRMARLMEDLEDKEDYEEFEMRKKSEQAAKLLEEKRFQHRDSDNEDEDDYDDEIERDENDDYGDYRGEGGYTSDPELINAKRSYKFGSDKNQRRERDTKSQTRNRPKSAKTYDEKDLRNVKLTTKDYLDHEKSQKQRNSSKYKITVPKPFEFEIRDKFRSKSIRERKVDEMVAEKKIKEENIINHQFRSKPIPPEVLIPRYQTIMENNDRRRLEVKRNSVAITKNTEKPFNFYLRDLNKQKPDPEDYLPHDLKKPQFKANPIPRACSVLIFDQMIKQQEQARQERIRKQTELNYSKAKLPERMQMHEEKKKQMGPKPSEVDQYAFKPKINELVTREQFKKQQDKFNQKLNKKKSQLQVTQPKSPNFTKTATKNLDREYLNEGQTAPPVDKFKAALLKSMAQKEDKAAANPSGTKAMTLAMQRRREELEAKRKQEEEKKQADKERQEKQNRIKGVVQAALADRVKNDNVKRQKDLEDRKASSKKEFKANMDHIKNIAEKGRSRPLLVESTFSNKQATNLAKIKATKQYMEILKENNLDPKEHLNDEQKELIEEDAYMERRKKELGR